MTTPPIDPDAPSSPRNWWPQLIPEASASGNSSEDARSGILRANPARMYDYLLGGKNHYATDRAAVDQIRTVMPAVGAAAWANRGFHQRVAKWMAQQGITQFIDIGCGLPTMRNTHEVVQAINPTATVTYVDHDPVVITHAQALLAGKETTSVILADIRDPESLLVALYLDQQIELAEPVGLLCTAVLHFVADQDDPHGCLERVVAALAPGSYLALSHVTADQMPSTIITTGIGAYQSASEQVHPRRKAEVERFFTGLQLIPPYDGAPAELCRIGLWGCEDPEAADDESGQPWWAGVGRK